MRDTIQRNMIQGREQEEGLSQKKEGGCFANTSTSPFFTEYYENKQKTMKKKEALCAVVIKLIKVIAALLRDRRMFTETGRLKMAA